MSADALTPSFAAADWLILIVYSAGLVLFGLCNARRHDHSSDYFLASRGSGWLLIGLGLMASNISSTALVGLSGGAYASGISVYDYEWTAAVILAFYAIFLVSFVVKSRVYTMPEFLERRYDGRVRLYLTGLTLFLNVVVDCAGALYSGSLVLRQLMPDLAVGSLIWSVAGAAALYTLTGGLRAVMAAEAIQSCVLLAGSALVAFIAFDRAGGWHAVMRDTPPAMLSLIRPIDDPAAPWPGLLFGIPILGFYYWCTNQYIAQRVLSARNSDQARWGVLLAGLLKLPVLLLMVLPGTCALILFPVLPRADLVYPALIFGLLPIGVKGLVTAALIAATMASVASTLNSVSTLLTMDVVRRLRPGLSQTALVRAGRSSMALCLVVAASWAPQLTRFPSLWQYLQAMLAYAVPPIVALFLAGLFWSGANAAGAVAGLAAGALGGVALFASNLILGWTNLHFLYVAPLLLALSGAVLVGVSLRCPAPLSDGARALVWTPAYFREETERLRPLPLWNNYRVLAAVLMVLTAGVVFTFR